MGGLEEGAHIFTTFHVLHQACCVCILYCTLRSSYSITLCCTANIRATGRTREHCVQFVTRPCRRRRRTGMKERCDMRGVRGTPTTLLPLLPPWKIQVQARIWQSHHRYRIVSLSLSSFLGRRMSPLLGRADVELRAPKREAESPTYFNTLSGSIRRSFVLLGNVVVSTMGKPFFLDYCIVLKWYLFMVGYLT